LQKFLADRGFFPEERMTGTFGPLTQAALVGYQLSTGLVNGSGDTGAGRVGPTTMQALKNERVQESYNVVRAQGWRAL
jgi:peptidoglycan hydrolase-like protein with peptidoglycan-binding domain